MITNYLIKEESYNARMRALAEPEMKNISNRLYAQREDGCHISCTSFRVPSPKGVVLIAHGFSESASKHLENAWYFTKMGFHVYVMEHCGHGDSYRLIDDPELVHIDSYRRYVDDLNYVAHLIRKRHPDLPLYLYAHSMGGGIGAAAAAEEPNMFDKLILSSPMIRPDTGRLPWMAAVITARLFCLFGQRMRRATGTPYDGSETYEESACLSPARFYAYKEKRDQDIRLQLTSATYGWILEAIRLNRYLRKKAIRRIKADVLLFKAENDTFVSGKAQDRFAAKLCERGRFAELFLIEGGKHELYAGTDAMMETYWTKIEEFLK